MQTHSNNPYYVPPPSIWPLVGSIALLTLATGFALLLNKTAVGPYVMALGAGILLFMLFGWFGNVISESLAGKYAGQEDASFRWGMMWFIFSEVMFIFQLAMIVFFIVYSRIFLEFGR